MNENVLDLLKTRYFAKNKNGEFLETTWEDICFRVSEDIALAEDDNAKYEYYLNRFYDRMANMEFIPSSPCLFNAGTGLQQLSSCFIIDFEDTMEDITTAWQEIAIIAKSGGGVGYNASKIRPKGTFIKSSGGEASGVISLMMKIPNQIIEEIKQGGKRKGALKVDLNDHHPEIFDFINCKQDTSVLKNMNISVSVSDEFMDAVVNDLDWDLHYDDEVSQTVKAREIWDLLMYNTWKTGEPAISFRDTMNNENKNPHMGQVNAGNPCLHHSSYMITENGLIKIKNIRGDKIWNGDVFSEGSKSWCTGIKDTVKIKTNSGFEYITTPDHKFMLADGSWCEAKDLLNKRIKFNLQDVSWTGVDKYDGQVDYRLAGFTFGDGSYHKASGRVKYIYFTPDKDDEVTSLFEREFDNETYPVNLTEKVINVPLTHYLSNLFDEAIENRMIPDWVMQLPKEKMKDFLQGLFSANGCNLEKYSKIQLVSVNKEMLKQVQQMLLLFGIKSKLWVHNKTQTIEFRNGEYECQESYHLVISSKSYVRFMEEISFIQTYKQSYNKERNYKDEFLYEDVIEIVNNGKAEVWDFTEPIKHYSFTNGAVVHNCHEFVNIPYSSCNLGSINLEKIVDDYNSINWEYLDDLIKDGVRFLDNMITRNKLPLQKLTDITNAIRPIGLGTMGYANMLYLLGLRYSSKEAMAFTDELYQFIKDSAIKKSIELANERGVYPAWNGSVWQQEGIVIRNSNHLSIAPNGSIGFIASTTGGTEPEYALVYQRETNEGKKYFMVNTVFEKVLKERDLYSDELIQRIYDNGGSIQNLTDLPEDVRHVFVVSQDLTPDEHLDTLAIIQKHVDLSISKTINMPSNTTVESMSDIYIKAWKMGIKGCTVYVDGSRDEQVLTTGKTNEKPTVTLTEVINDLKRGDWKPKAKDTLYHEQKIYIGCGKLTLMIGWSAIEQSIQDFYVIRSGSGGCERNLQDMVIAMSGMLRLGGNISNIEKAFEGVGGCNSFVNSRKDGKKLSRGNNCGNAILNSIKAFLSEQSLKQTYHECCGGQCKVEEETIEVVNEDKNKCSVCGKLMISIGGCYECKNCGYSKCN